MSAWASASDAVRVIVHGCLVMYREIAGIIGTSSQRGVVMRPLWQAAHVTRTSP